MELEEYIEKLSAIRDGLDEKIRDARGLLKDVEKQNKDMNDILSIRIAELVDERIGEVVEIAMNDLAKQLNETIDRSEKLIEKRFERIADTFLGKSDKTEYPLEVLLLARAMFDDVVAKAGRRQGAIIVKRDSDSLPPALGGKKARPKIRGEVPPWGV